MRIQTPPNQPKPKPVQLESGSDWAGRIGSAIADNPILAISDAVDLGAGIANASGAFAGSNSGAVLQGTSVVMGAYHGIKAFYHLTVAADPYTRDSKHDLTMMAGEVLSATGHFTAAAGIGPVSLGFLGLGMVVTNAATLTQ